MTAWSATPSTSTSAEASTCEPWRAMPCSARCRASGTRRWSAVCGFAPRQSARPSAASSRPQTAWGTVTLDAKRLTVNVDEGELALSKVVIGSGKQQVTIEQSALVKAGSPLGIPLPASKARAKSTKTKKKTK